METKPHCLPCKARINLQLTVSPNVMVVSDPAPCSTLPIVPEGSWDDRQHEGNSIANENHPDEFVFNCFHRHAEKNGHCEQQFSCMGASLDKPCGDRQTRKRSAGNIALNVKEHIDACQAYGLCAARSLHFLCWLHPLLGKFQGKCNAEDARNLGGKEVPAEAVPGIYFLTVQGCCN